MSKKKKQSKFRKHLNFPQKVENKEAQVAQNKSVSQRFEVERFVGPLPPPDILKKYDEIFPGSAEIIIKMAMTQSEHRQKLEQNVINSDIRNSKMGLWFALIISLCGIAGTVFCAAINQPAVGCVLGGGTLATIVSTFVYGTASRKKEREQKRQKE